MLNTNVNLHHGVSPFICLPDFFQNNANISERILMKFCPNIDYGRRKRCFNFGDILESRGHLTFDLPKIISQEALIIMQLYYITLY